MEDSTGDKMTYLRIDPKTRRLIISDLTPPIRSSLTTMAYYAEEIAGAIDKQIDLLKILFAEQEQLKYYLDSPTKVKLYDKHGVIRTLDELLVPQDFALEVGRGNIPGITAVHKFGEAPSGVQTTATDIWDRADATPTQQIWTAPTQARTHTIASTDANDTDGGTGARTVMIFGLTSWDTKEVSETVTMNTGSPPVTVNSYVIIHRMRVVASGATSVNIGTITATATGDATITAAIRPSEGTTHMAIYGWPSTQKLYLIDWSGSINKASGAAGTINFKLAYNPEPNMQLTHFSVRREKGVQSTGTNDMVWPLNYLELDGPGIVKIQGIGSAADIDGSAGFDGYLINNKI